jgi:hypothetical protein
MLKLKEFLKNEDGLGILGASLGYFTGCIGGFIAPCGPFPLLWYGCGQMFAIPAGILGGIAGMIGDMLTGTITGAGLCITRGGASLSQNINSAILLCNSFISHIWELIGL